MEMTLYVGLPLGLVAIVVSLVIISRRAAKQKTDYRRLFGSRHSPFDATQGDGSSSPDSSRVAGENSASLFSDADGPVLAAQNLSAEIHGLVRNAAFRVQRHPSLLGTTVLEFELEADPAVWDLPTFQFVEVITPKFGPGLRDAVDSVLKPTWLDTARAPLVYVDAPDFRFHELKFLIAQSGLQRFVCEREGLVCCRVSTEWPTAQQVASNPNDVEAERIIAVPSLRAAEGFFEQFPQTIVPDPLALAESGVTVDNDRVVSVVGCPETDLGTVPERLMTTGLTVRKAGEVLDQDFVVFCYSCAHGPTAETRRAVQKCNERTIRPVAIVQVDHEQVDDDSLRSLVSLEVRDLLLTILPEEVIDELPVFYDFDPGLVYKLVKMIGSRPAEVRCESFA